MLHCLSPPGAPKRILVLQSLSVIFMNKNEFRLKVATCTRACSGPGTRCSRRPRSDRRSESGGLWRGPGLPVAQLFAPGTCVQAGLWADPRPSGPHSLARPGGRLTGAPRVCFSPSGVSLAARGLGGEGDPQAVRHGPAPVLCSGPRRDPGRWVGLRAQQEAPRPSPPNSFAWTPPQPRGSPCAPCA